MFESVITAGNTMNVIKNTDESATKYYHARIKAFLIMIKNALRGEICR